MSGDDYIDTLSAAGFSEQEITLHMQGKRDELSAAGFSDEEIDTYYGSPPINDEPLERYVKQVIDGVLDEFQGPDDPVTGERPGFSELVIRGAEAGWNASSVGMYMRGQMPDPIQYRSSVAASLPRSLATLAGDLPLMLSGAAVAAPGGPVAMLATAFALPAAARVVLMQAYTKGEVVDVADFFQRQSDIFLAGTKGALTGASTALAGGLATTTLRKVGAEVVTMTTVGSVLEGHIPTPRDFFDAAVILYGFRGAQAVLGRGVTMGQQTVVRGRSVLMEIYAKTGKRPSEVLADMEIDPRILEDVLAALDPNARRIPRAYAGLIEEGDTGARGEPPRAPSSPRPAQLLDAKVADAQARVSARISVGGKTERSTNTLDMLYTEVVDSTYPLFKLVENLRDGTELKADLNPYYQSRFVPAAMAKSQLFLDIEVRRFGSTEVVSRGLKLILEPVNKDLDGFRAYITSKRTVELSARGIKTGVDLADATVLVKAGKAKYEATFRELVVYQDAVLTYLRDSGVISESSFKKMTAVNRDYVPFFRLFTEETGGARSGSATPGSPVKRISKTGSDRIIVDPLESIIKNTYAFVQLAERNAVGVKLVELAETMQGTGETALVRRIKPQVTPITVKASEMTPLARRMAEEFGIDFTPDEFTVFRAKSLRESATEIAVYRDGKREVYEVGADVAEAMNGMDGPSANLFIKIMSAPARTLRAGAILNPEFFVKNLFRDTISAGVFSTGNFRPFFDTIMGMGELMKKGEVYRDWMASGGGNATFISLDRAYLQQSLKGLLTTTGLGKVKNLVTSPLELLRIGAELSENATRLGLYLRKTQGRRDVTSRAEGAFESREGTLDFAKMGASMRGYNGVSAFLSARINGYDRLFRAFKDNPVRATAIATATITMPSIALWLANHDDPRYQALPQWQKDLFWIIIVDGEDMAGADGPGTGRLSKPGTIYRVPKPFELGIMFGTSVEHLLEAYKAHNPDALAGMVEAFGADVVSSLVPTMAGPIVEQIANYSIYRDAPLIPGSLEHLVPDMQFTTHTTELAKALSEITSLVSIEVGVHPSEAGVSPIVLENYVRQWTGGLGSYAMEIADKALRVAGVVPESPAPATVLADIPFIKAFVIRFPSSGAQPIRDFYDRLKELRVLSNSIQALRETGDQADWDKADRLEALDPLAMLKLSGYQKTMGEQTSLIRSILKNPDMSPDEKRELIDNTYYFLIELAKDGNELMNMDMGQ
jgi:hypothetical protein